MKKPKRRKRPEPQIVSPYLQDEDGDLWVDLFYDDATHRRMIAELVLLTFDGPRPEPGDPPREKRVNLKPGQYMRLPIPGCDGYLADSQGDIWSMPEK